MQMEQYLALIISSVEQFGVWFVVGFLFLENVPVVGFFAPGLTVLVLSGFLFEIITGNWALLFLIAWLTIFVADTLWYSIGYFAQDKNTLLQKLATRSPNVENLLRTQPIYALLTYQFIPYYRMFLPFALGMYRFSVYRWLPICLIGSALYTAVFYGVGLVGAFIWKEAAVVELVVNRLNVFLGVAIVVYTFFLLRKYYRLRRQQD